LDFEKDSLVDGWTNQSKKSERPLLIGLKYPHL
jgi:hypothetical protein